MSYTNNKGADYHVHAFSFISVISVHCLDHTVQNIRFWFLSFMCKQVCDKKKSSFSTKIYTVGTQ